MNQLDQWFLERTGRQPSWQISEVMKRYFTTGRMIRLIFEPHLAYQFFTHSTANCFTIHYRSP